MNKKLGAISSLCLTSLVSLTLATPSAAAAERPKSATMDFRTSTVNGKTVADARVIVVGDDGKVKRTGLTNKDGNWRVTLPVVTDPRFATVRDLDTVTAIVIATGYNERVIFEVPVEKRAVESIVLTPVKPNRRNEPSMGVGSIHRHDLAQFINAYASAIGLQRQTSIAGEQGYAPWGPEIAQNPTDPSTPDQQGGQPKDRGVTP